MNRIGYAELGDMEYYNKDYKEEDWANKSSKDFMDFYNENKIDIDVTTWARLNIVDDKMYYKEAFSSQICFIRDDIGDLFFNRDKNWDFDEHKLYFDLKQRSVKADSVHMSKSILLPVYRIYADGKDDLIITISDNFHGYQVSVECKLFGINLDFDKLFNINKVPNFMYGFKENRIFGSYSKDICNFSFGISNKYHLYMVMYQISEQWKEMAK